MKQASVLFLSALLLPCALLAQEAPTKRIARPVPCFAKAQGWIGKHFSEDGRVAAPGDITPAMLPAWNRIILPGQGVTRDANPDRLNLELDGQGVIVSVYCG